MPQLPDIDSLGSRPVPQSNRGVASERNADAAANAFANIGETVGAIGNRMVEKQDKLSYAAARAALLSADMKTRAELQDDPNYGTYESRYTEKMAAAKATAAGFIRSRSDRAMFELDAQTDTNRGLAEIGGLVRTKRRQARQGVLAESLQTLQDVGQGAPDDATRETTIKTAGEAIQAAVEAGDITPEQGVTQRAQWTQNYVGQRINSLIAKEDFTSAQAYLEANRGRLDPAVESRFNEQLTGAANYRDMVSGVEDIVHGGGPAVATYVAGKPKGLKASGNIDIMNRPVHKNSDGSISTVRSISIGTDQGEVLIPTISDDGKALSDQQAIALYNKTGRNLGVFDTEANATAYAKSLHQQQAATYGAGKASPAAIPTGFANVASRIIDIEGGGKYVANDNGKGPTRWGINSAANPGVDIANLTREGALSIYRKKYWDALGLDKQPPGVALMAFDAAVNQGPERAAQWLKQSGGDIDRFAALRQAAYDQTKGPNTAWNKRLADVTQTAGGRGAQQSPGEHDLNAIYSRIDQRADAEQWTPEKRERWKQQADRVVQRDETLLRRDQSQAYDAALTQADKLGDNFTDVSQLGDSYYRASPEQKHTLNQRAEANRAPKAVKADGDVALGLNLLANGAPDEFLSTDLRGYRAQMTPGEFASLAVLQTKMRANPKGPEAVGHEKIWGVISRYGPDVGVDPTPSANLGAAKVKEQRQQSQQIFTMMQRDLEAVTGGKRQPNDDEVKAAWDRSVMTVKQVTPGILYGESKTEMPRFKVPPGQAYRVDVPNDVRARIMQSYRRQGVPNPSEQDIASTYMSNKGRQGFWP